MLEHFISKIDTLMKKPNLYSQLKDKKVSFDYIQGMNGGSFSFLADSFEASNFGYQNEGFYQSPWKITLVKHSQENIDKKRKASKDKLNEANLHAYDMARGALNLQAGEFAHHLVQGSSCLVDSLKYSREVSRMEKENRAEENKR